MMGVALCAGMVDFAVALYISFVAYLRPGELINLTGPQLVEPLAGAGVAWWSLLIAPEELGAPSKIGTFDETALLDTHVILDIAPVLRRLKQRAGKERLWNFTQPQFAKLFHSIAEEAGVAVLHPHPYSLRHGGASHGSLHRHGWGAAPPRE